MAREKSLRLLAGAGFQDLDCARKNLARLAALVPVGKAALRNLLSVSADPDEALTRLNTFFEMHPHLADTFNEEHLAEMALLFGASAGLAAFYTRNPDTYPGVNSFPCWQWPCTAVGLADKNAAWCNLRKVYRQKLGVLALQEMRAAHSGRAEANIPFFTGELSELAGEAFAGALNIARAAIVAGLSGPAVSQKRMDAVRLAIIGMGKCGAGELNVVSDVDVMFVAESADEQVLSGDALLRLASRLASETMRAIQDPVGEPPLWQVDAGLRPEGRNGALVRTLSGMFSYYEKWAKTWEFQALLKARAIAGDIALGESFIAGVQPLVWSSASREDFVANVQAMRERVTEHLAVEEREIHLKLGSGGMRDIEFSVQLLQLVHGQNDPSLRTKGTLDSLAALEAGGYISRADAETLSADYSFLRVLENHLQLAKLRRTSLMPENDGELRVLARSTGLAKTAQELRALWHSCKLRVRRLNTQIFYAPLLSAVAALPEHGFSLDAEKTFSRLQGMGFKDAEGALRHMRALTDGSSRSALILRTLLPVFLGWLADGADPDYGLLAFRRLCEASKGSPAFLRLLRDGGVAAERLCFVLSCSRFASELLIGHPDAVSWLADDEALKPRDLKALASQLRLLAARRPNVEDAAATLRTQHRKEVLRLALGRVVRVLDDGQVAAGLNACHTALLDGLLLSLVTAKRNRVQIALIGMGRFGGLEQGFASDIDLLAVSREVSGESTGLANQVVAQLKRLVADPLFPLDIDFDLRPEGKKGPLARSLESYRAYYAKWASVWEVQALLRARFVAGDVQLGEAFMKLADEVRYPQTFSEDSAREVRMLKARVETERMPHGVSPEQHLKLGPGGISDVEWFTQLIQLQYAHRFPGLQTPRTLAALNCACEHGLIESADRDTMAEAWLLAGTIRSAIKLVSGVNSDVLPGVHAHLAAVAALQSQHPPRVEGAAELQEKWLKTARHCRHAFERLFFG